MKISTKGRYGLKAMIDIAAATENGERVNLRTVAEKRGISDSYLEQLVSQLKKAGLVASKRGARGGYFLSRAASEISVGEILRALEGSLSPADCVESESAVCGTGDCACCGAKSVWDKIYLSVNRLVDSITLRDLIDEMKQGT